MKHCLLTILFIVALVSFLAPSYAKGGNQRFDKKLEELSEILTVKRGQYHIPGMALVVVGGNKSVYTKSIGLSDLENSRQVTKDTIFGVGSLTKAFTATLIGMMVDSGKMRWDSPLTDFLPEHKYKLKNSDEAVTIRDLLSHRTGFNRFNMLYANEKLERSEVLEASLNAIAWSGFRSKFIYNNVMYLAAGIAAEKRAGQLWDDMIAEKIFTPLSMTSSYAQFGRIPEEQHVSKGYSWSDDQGTHISKRHLNLNNIAPAASIYSTVSDMGNWLLMHMNSGSFKGRSLISTEQLNATKEAQIAVNHGASYGMGWVLKEWEGQKVIFHTGIIEGFSSIIAHYPESNLAFVLLTNLTNSPLIGEAIDLVGYTLIEGLTKNGDGESVRKSSLSSVGKGKSKATPGVVSQPMNKNGKDQAEAVDIERYVGYYPSDLFNGDLRVVINDGQLALDIPNRRAFKLLPPDSSGQWAFNGRPSMKVKFNLNAEEQVVSLSIYKSGKKLGTALRVDEKQQPAIHKTNLPSMEELMRRLNYSQRVEEYSAIAGIKMRGTVSMLQSGVSGEIISYFKNLSHHLEVMDFGKFGEIKTVLNPDNAVTTASHHEPRIHTGKYYDQLRRLAPFSLIDWLSLYGSSEVVSVHESKGEKVYDLKSTSEDGLVTKIYINASTGDLVKLVTQIEMQDLGVVPTVYTFEEYNSFGGVRLPVKSTITNDFNGTMVITWENIEVNADLDDELFII